MAKEFSRTQRVASQIQRELAVIIQQEIRDPRLGMVSISGVEVSRDLGHAKIYVTVMAPEVDVETSLGILNRAAGFLRRALGQHMVVRTLPELRFVYDASLERGRRVTELIDALAAERRDDEQDDTQQKG